MGEIGTFIRGNGLQKKDFTESGIGCIHYGQIYTHYGTFADKTLTYVSEAFGKKLQKASKNDIVIATTSENVEDVCKAVAWLGEEQIAISGDAYIFKHNQNAKYIAYFFQTESFQKQKKPYVTGTKVMRVSGENMAKIKIPIPTLALQEKIVSILDRFESLVNDLTAGLPAEIEARRQQYEYYRNQLLTFKRLA
jgi:type I restriction enzyme S subunit